MRLLRWLAVLLALALFGVAIGRHRSGASDALLQRQAALRAAGRPATLAELAATTPRSDETSRQRFLVALADFNESTRRAESLTWRRTHLPITASQWHATNVPVAQAACALTAKVRRELHAALGNGDLRLGVELTATGQSVVSPISDVIDAVRWLDFERELAVVAGDGAAVAQLTTESLRLAATLGPGSWIDFIGRVVADNVTLKALPEAMGRNCLTVPQLASLRRELNQHLAPSLLEHGLHGERLSMVQLWPTRFQQLADLNSLPPLSLRALSARLYFLAGQSSRDRLRYFDWVEDWIRAATFRPWSNALPAMRQLSPPAPIRLFQLSQFSVLPMITPQFQQVVEEAFRRECQLRAASSATAVLEWRRRHDGRLPESLVELADLEPPPLTTDPSDEQPLRYRPGNTGFTVYSVGADGIDNGATGDDVVFAVKWWQPAPEVLQALKPGPE